MRPPLSFAAVAHRLGIGQRPRTWQMRHIRWLIDTHEFPSPLPSPRFIARTLYWDARAIDCWFDDRIGTAADREDAAIVRAAATMMDTRATELASRAGNSRQHAGATE